jgi:hypothetical protein
VVVDKGRNLCFGNAGIDVGIKYFEEIAKALPLGLESKLLKLAERLMFLVKVVGECESVEQLSSVFTSEVIISAMLGRWFRTYRRVERFDSVGAVKWC